MQTNEPNPMQPSPTPATLADELRACVDLPAETRYRVIERAASLLTSQAAAIREKDLTLKAIADMRFDAETNHAELLALILAVAKTAGGRR